MKSRVGGGGFVSAKQAGSEYGICCCGCASWKVNNMYCTLVYSMGYSAMREDWIARASCRDVDGYGEGTTGTF